MSRRDFASMLRCSDGSDHVGSTTDLELRIRQHNEGLGAAHTRHRRPVVLVWHEEFDRVDDAFARETQVQNCRPLLDHLGSTILAGNADGVRSQRSRRWDRTP